MPIRSLVISYKLLGTRKWLIIHHTDCGMELFTNETMPELLEKSLEDGATGRGQGGDPGRRGIGLVEIPFVEPESGSLPSGPSRRPRRKWAPVTRAVFESKVAIN